MNQTNSPETQLLNPTLEEQKMLQQLRENPYLGTQFQIIANQFETEISNGMDAHQAEEALIISLQQLGKTMMIQWAENTQRKVLEDDPTLQKHSKKN